MQQEEEQGSAHRGSSAQAAPPAQLEDHAGTSGSDSLQSKPFAAPQPSAPWEGTQPSPGRDPAGIPVTPVKPDKHLVLLSLHSIGSNSPQEQLVAGNTAFPGRVTASTATYGNCFC